MGISGYYLLQQKSSKLRSQKIISSIQGTADLTGNRAVLCFGLAVKIAMFFPVKTLLRHFLKKQSFLFNKNSGIVYVTIYFLLYIYAKGLEHTQYNQS